MSNKDKDLLKKRIKNAIIISSQRLIQKKKSLGQKLIISENGVIITIEP